MADDKYCADSCSGCYTCEVCNSCQLCQSKQTFCNLNCQTFGEYESFSFSYSPSQNNIIGPGYFDQDVWDEIIEYINRLRAKGKTQSSGSAYPLSSISNVSPFKASEFNRVAGYITDERGNQITNVKVSSGDVIYGSYFQILEADVENAELNFNACDKCNTGCQECNTINSDACGGGQKCNDMVNNGCQSCDSCENHCDDTPAPSDK